MKLKQYITEINFMDDKEKKKASDALIIFMKSAKSILESVPLERKERNVIQEGLKIAIQKVRDIQEK